MTTTHGELVAIYPPHDTGDSAIEARHHAPCADDLGAKSIRDAILVLREDHRSIEEHFAGIIGARDALPSSHRALTTSMASFQHLILTDHRKQETGTFPLLIDHMTLDLDQLLAIWTRFEAHHDSIRLRTIPKIHWTWSAPEARLTGDVWTDIVDRIDRVTHLLVSHAQRELQLIREVVGRHHDSGRSSAAYDQTRRV